MKLRRTLLYAFLILIVGANALLYWQRTYVGDWLRLRNYAAPAAVSSLASEDTMTSYAQRLFYVNHPALEAKDSFNRHCADKTEQAAVLGCYHGNRQGIYLYDVTDERLQGVEQVTAAHEMLHQAYDRLTGGERQRIQSLLEDFYQHGLQNQEVKDKIDLYRKANTPDLTNEMHSIFGTEIASLPTELETYYQQYFGDRQKVVAYSVQYQAAFQQLQDKVAAYDAQLAALDAEINAARAELDTALQAIQAREQELKKGPQGDIAAYNQSVRQYNAMIDAYNAKVAATSAKIDQYNQIVADRNAIAVQERSLQQALDSRVTPVAQ